MSGDVGDFQEATMINLRTLASLSTVMVAAWSASASGARQPRVAPREASIVFVCEHGAAKSVIAATLFNKLAAERGLRQRAIYRGATPQAELSAATLKGLRDDGLLLPADKPAPITPGDVNAATYIFAIGCTLPESATASGKAESWTDVPEVSDGYAAARDAIRRHVQRLIELLQNP
jgi:arsenate reductase